MSVSARRAGKMWAKALLAFAAVLLCCQVRALAIFLDGPHNSDEKHKLVISSMWHNSVPMYCWLGMAYTDIHSNMDP